MTESTEPHTPNQKGHTMTEREELLTTQGAADYLHVKLRTFYSWRYEGGDYPPAIRLGSHLRYRKSVLDAWIDAHTEKPGDTPVTGDTVVAA